MSHSPLKRREGLEEGAAFQGAEERGFWRKGRERGKNGREVGRNKEGRKGSKIAFWKEREGKGTIALI